MVDSHLPLPRHPGCSHLRV